MVPLLQILCAWSKLFLSWSNPIVLSSPISISLPNSAQNNIFYRINTPHANEYFLLENRQFVGFDIGLPGTGLAIWHINTSKTTTSHIDANDVNADENLKGVDLEEADGDLDLDNNINRGDDGDLFPGNSCNLFFRDNTTPSSQTYSPVVNTNKPVANIAESGNNIRFDFMGYNPISGPSTVCTSGATFTINNLPQVDSIIWETGPFLTVYSGQNTDSLVIKATGSGNSWVMARLVNDCGSITLPQKPVGVGEPVKDDFHFVMLNISTGEYVPNFTNNGGNPVELCPNTVYQLWTDYYGPFTIQDLDWLLPYGWEIQAQYGSNNSFTTYLEVNDNVNTALFLTVQTAGWKEGIYLVRVNYNGEILTGKLIVKR